MATTEIDDAIEGELVEYMDGSAALAALNRSEIDQQIATAKRWPRSIKQFKANCMELACLDEETAASMFYVLPRAGKKIEGPSARLAEVVGSSWGNLRYGARIVATDDKFVTAQGACFDLEKNIAITVEIKRRITDKNGRRFNDDMIGVTSNAASSIALRQAIFKIVPFALVKPIYEQARLTSVGKASSLVERRQKAVDWFLKAGATVEQVLAAIEKKGVDDITLDDLVTLTGLRTAIKDGESSIEEALGPIPDKNAKVKKSDLNDQIGKKPGDTAKQEKPKATTKQEQQTPEETSQETGSESEVQADPFTDFADDMGLCQTRAQFDAMEAKYRALCGTQEQHDNLSVSLQPYRERVEQLEAAASDRPPENEHLARLRGLILVANSREDILQIKQESRSALIKKQIKQNESAAIIDACDEAMKAFPAKK